MACNFTGIHPFTAPHISRGQKQFTLYKLPWDMRQNIQTPVETLQREWLVSRLSLRGLFWIILWFILVKRTCDTRLLCWSDIGLVCFKNSDISAVNVQYQYWQYHCPALNKPFSYLIHCLCLFKIWAQSKPLNPRGGGIKSCTTTMYSATISSSTKNSGCCGRRAHSTCFATSLFNTMPCNVNQACKACWHLDIFQ